MATQLLSLETAFLNGLTAVQFSASLSAADIGTMEQLVVDDLAVRQQAQSASPIQAGIVFTANVTTTALSGLTSVSVASPSGATIANIQPGQWLYGPGVPAGAQVISASSTTIHFSGTDTPTTVQTGGYYFTIGKKMAGCINTQGQLVVPNRGVLKVLPGDVIAVDPSGWPILLSQQAIDYAGTAWVLT